LHRSGGLEKRHNIPTAHVLVPLTQYLYREQKPGDHITHPC